MRISQTFGLNKSQYELDFVDIDPSGDMPLFLDPYFLSYRKDPWSVKATQTFRSFFQEFIRLVRAGREGDARNLLNYLGEPNETCLGLSKDSPRGNAIGDVFEDKLHDSLLQSEAIRTGLVEDLEDTRVFIKGIDRDRLSDMTTNIIRKHLIEYTQAQCQLWGIPLRQAPSSYCWNGVQRRWVNEYDDMLVVNDQRLLLVPKAIVGYAQKYAAQEYRQHYVLNFLKADHLRRNTSLVQTKIRKDGSVRRFVTKKRIVEAFEDDGVVLDKEWLANFTESHPEVFQDFKQKTIDKIEVMKSGELTATSLSDVVEHLITTLQGTEPGARNASRYHRLVTGILELIFYPHLVYPQVEREIHQGRKRIDIIYENAATEDFFFRLHNTHQIPSGTVYVECKNYSTDVANPELDQLSGRFSVNRGKAGLLLSRSVEDMSLLKSRCTDTFRDDRGLIIPLVDNDLIELLGFVARYDYPSVDRFLVQRMRDITMG